MQKTGQFIVIAIISWYKNSFNLFEIEPFQNTVDPQSKRNLGCVNVPCRKKGSVSTVTVLPNSVSPSAQPAPMCQHPWSHHDSLWTPNHHVTDIRSIYTTASVT